MIDEIEKYLQSIDFKTLSMTDLKAYTEIAISIEQYRSSAEMLKGFKNAPEKLVLN